MMANQTVKKRDIPVGKIGRRVTIHQSPIQRLQVKMRQKMTNQTGNLKKREIQKVKMKYVNILMQFHSTMSWTGVLFLLGLISMTYNGCFSA